MSVERLLHGLRTVGPRLDDDWSDRLQYFVTSNVLIVASSLSAYKFFEGPALECLTPATFSRSFSKYAENYCWAQDTYFLPPDVHVAKIDKDERYSPERQLSYYKWVPFFLLLEAAMFRLPSIFWSYLSLSSGIRIHEIVERAMDPNNVEDSVKAKNIETLTRHMQNALKFHRRIMKRNIQVHKTLKVLNIRYTAFFISLMYLVTKFLYLANVVLQLYFMNKFLRTDKYEWYGFGVIRDILHGTVWQTSGTFPRISLCDFEVRQMGNIHRHSVQCVLVINMFNEKIFVLLWFWYMTLTVCTVLSFVYWFVLLAFPCFSRWFISQSLELSEMKFDPDTKSKEVRRFVSNYLRHDGIFVLRMVEMHAGIIFGTDLVLSLWNAFYSIEEKLSEGRTPVEDVKDNASNFLKQRKKKSTEEDLKVDLDSCTQLLPVSPDNPSNSTSED